MGTLSFNPPQALNLYCDIGRKQEPFALGEHYFRCGAHGRSYLAENLLIWYATSDDWSNKVEMSLPEHVRVS